MRHYAWAFFLLAASAFGADVTGKWSGTFAMQREDGETRNASALAILKQDGAKVTGTAGPDEARAAEIKSGTIEGNKVKFVLEQPNGAIIAFELTLDGDRLSGMAKGDDNGQARQAKVDLTRSK